MTKARVLIVEDEKMLSEMYSDRLEAAGIDVQVAGDVPEALAAVKDQQPDLILLDILLPKESGIIFIEKLRQEKHGFDIPILAFSNFDDQETKDKAAQLGVKEYLIKTAYTPQQLTEKVKNYLNL